MFLVTKTGLKAIANCYVLQISRSLMPLLNSLSRSHSRSLASFFPFKSNTKRQFQTKNLQDVNLLIYSLFFLGSNFPLSLRFNEHF